MAQTLINPQRLRLFLLLLLPFVAALILWLLQTHTPSQLHLPACQFHALTGLYCPGCGATRAVFHLLHGHFSLALRSNFLFVLALPIFGYLWLATVTNSFRPGTIPLMRISANGTRIIGLIILLWVILRNLPFAIFHIPG